VPELSAAEVARYVALGREGRERFRTGDAAGAAARFRAQIAIFPPNPEPFASLALLAAGRGADEAALEHLHAAVIRGFTDLLAIERAEAWTGIGRPTQFLKLRDAVLRMAKVERDWPEWRSLGWLQAPASYEAIERRQADLDARLEAMAPALGPRLLRLWKKVIARGTAWRCEAYIAAHPQAADLEQALERLMTLYTGGPLRCWGRLPGEIAGRLAAAATLALQRFPDSPMRPAALVGLALARNGERDRQGVLRPNVASEIRARLGEVVTQHPDSPLLALAVTGLVRTDVDAGRFDDASLYYRKFREAHAGRRALLDRVQRELGVLALQLGGLPEFRETTLGGNPVEPAALLGKVVVFDFWATWCEPCLEQFPTLRRIDERYGEDVVVLGINLDGAEELSVQKLLEWIERERVPGDHVHDGLGWESRLVKAFGVNEIPFNVVAGPDGSVLAVNEQDRRLEKVVRNALRDNPRPR
jgi:thiol-disulfide isomerase/thioredoxin